jgi:hypothetical protein
LRIVDEFGLTAFEKFCEGNSENEDDVKWIRLEKQPDECLTNIVTQDDIWRKIAEVRLEQARNGLSDLYLREWESTNGQASTGAKSVISVMQFNTLRGLSSGPTQSWTKDNRAFTFPVIFGFGLKVASLNSGTRSLLGLLLCGLDLCKRSLSRFFAPMRLFARGPSNPSQIMECMGCIGWMPLFERNV